MDFIVDADPFNFSGDLTIEAWIKPDDITVGNQEITEVVVNCEGGDDLIFRNGF